MIKQLVIIMVLGIGLVGTAQEDATPKGWVVLDSIIGNLDKNTEKEKVVVYDTTDSTEFGKLRELRIFTKEKGNWALWKTLRTALLKSDDGGMMGDPYGGMEIEKRVLHIHHNGGSSWKWGYTDKYRYQNNQFELIGYTRLSGKPCEEWTTVDYNLYTGKINYTHEVEDCGDEDHVRGKKERET